MIFAAVGAVSAGIEVELDLLVGDAAHLSASTASLAFSIPIALYLATSWAVLLRAKFVENKRLQQVAEIGERRRVHASQLVQREPQQTSRIAISVRSVFSWTHED